MLYTGQFNSMRQCCLPDGTREVTVAKRGEGKVYRFTVRDLYGQHEKVLKHEVIDVKTRRKPWVTERMRKAQDEQRREKHG